MIKFAKHGIALYSARVAFCTHTAGRFALFFPKEKSAVFIRVEYTSHQ